MKRLIINNHTDLDDERAVILVSQVIANGRISNDGKQYCYATTFRDVYDTIHVVTSRVTPTGNDVFDILEDKKDA